MHIRTSDLAVKEFSRTYSVTTDSAYIIATRGMELLNDHYGFSAPLRSVGIRAINLKGYETAVQSDIFGSNEKIEAEEKLENSIYKVREKFGSQSIRRASAAKECGMRNNKA